VIFTIRIILSDMLLYGSYNAIKSKCIMAIQECQYLTNNAKPVHCLMHYSRYNKFINRFHKLP